MRVTVTVDCDQYTNSQKTTPIFGIGVVREKPADWQPGSRKCFVRPCHRFGGIDVMFEMTADQFTTVRVVSFRDRHGNTVPVPENPGFVWQTTNSDILDLEVSEDTKTVKVSATGVVGEAEVQLSVDADSNPDTPDIFGRLNIKINPGSATEVELGADTAQDIPPSP